MENSTNIINTEEILYDEERYLDLDSEEEKLNEMSEDEREIYLEIKRERKQKEKEKQEQEQEKKDDDMKSDDSIDIEKPSTDQQRKIIEKTAKFITESSNPQMEIVIQAKQSSNPLFNFLNKNDILYPYYRRICLLMRMGIYTYSEEEELINANENKNDENKISKNNEESNKTNKKYKRKNIENENSNNNNKRIKNESNNVTVSSNSEIVELPLPERFEDIFGRDDESKWLEAVNYELNNMKEKNVYTFVKYLPKNKNKISVRWIFSYKRNSDGKIVKYKARLVARGFTQISGIDYIDVFSPTLKQDSLRILISIAIYYNYDIYQIDIKAAYLNANIEEELYIDVPPGCENYKQGFWKLNKALYGLKQAGRMWNIKLDNTLVKLRFNRLKSEPCIYVKIKKLTTKRLYKILNLQGNVRN